MIKAVIFDLGGVIVPLDFQAGYRAFAERCGLPAEEVPKRIQSTGLVPQLESGQVEPGEFMARICDVLNLQVDAAGFQKLWSSIFPSYTLIPESLLAGIRQNYRLVLLSNTNSIHFEMIRVNYPLVEQFHQHVLSYEVGVMKPGGRIYQAAIEACGCRPEECFFTDDVPAYVEGALKAGIDAVRFTGYAPLTGELDRRGIIWRRVESPLQP